MKQSLQHIEALRKKLRENKIKNITPLPRHSQYDVDFDPRFSCIQWLS